MLQLNYSSLICVCLPAEPAKCYCHSFIKILKVTLCLKNKFSTFLSNPNCTCHSSIFSNYAANSHPDYASQPPNNYQSIPKQ